MNWIEKQNKNVELAIVDGLQELNTSRENVEIEIIDEGSIGFLGIFGVKPAKIRMQKKFNVINEINDFLSSFFANVDEKFNSSIQQKQGNTFEVLLSGENLGFLIGSRGATLESLQNIISLYINKLSTCYINITLDIENYREKRKETLERLANSIAYKVVQNKKIFSLEPMNSNERKIIHSALQNTKNIKTYSIGEEPYRKVVISYSEKN